MLFYVDFEPPEKVLNIEKVEELIMERFQLYSLTNNLQCDTEEFNYYDRITHLLMSIIAIDFCHFKKLFLNGEIRIFREKLKALTCSEMKVELSSVLQYLNNLSQSEEFEKLNLKQLNQFQLVRNIVETVHSKSGHTFRRNHLKNCRKFKLTLPFTFLLKLVAQREVEVKNGKVSLSCSKWDQVLELVFEYLLDLELKLLENCESLRKQIYELEDDRMRQIIRRFTNFLSGSLNKMRRNLKAVELDEESQHFPPCMANLHQILRKTHRLSYESRYQYTLFLKDIGLSVEENISFWENEYSKPHTGSTCTHEWEEKRKRYTYQIQHVYGLIGSHGLKSSHSCDKFIQDLQSKMDGGCPFQHLTADTLERCLPKSMKSVPDVEDILKYKSIGLPQKACAAYLRCHQKVLAKKNYQYDKPNVSKMFCVVSPLHYYNLAKNS